MNVIYFILALFVTNFTSDNYAVAATSRETKEIRSRLPEKLPSKSAAREAKAERSSTSKRTYIDFSSAEKMKPTSRLDKALKKSDQELAASQKPVEVRSRKILAAPQGDSAEPLSAMTSKPTSTPTPTLQREEKNEVPPATTVAEDRTPAQPVIEEAPVVQLEPAIAKPAPMKVDPIDLKPVATQPTEPETSRPEEIVDAVPVKQILAIKTTYVAKAPSDSMILFLRTGLLTAGYSKFDSRMQNGATSTGVGIAKAYESPWGAFEGRAAFDVYHATDQSVSLENVRMLAARAEAAYWLSHGRFQPGVSMGMGFTDYSIRSYRSIDGSGDVTVRTHAKSRALALIPAAAVRADLFEKSVVEAQVEYLGLFGGEAADAARGWALTLSLGWKI